MTSYHERHSPVESDPQELMSLRRYERLRRSLQPLMEELVSETISRLQEASNDPSHPFTRAVMALLDEPLTDRLDADGWLQHMPLREKAALGTAVLTLVADAQLSLAEAVEHAIEF